MNANEVISIISNAISKAFPDAEIYKEIIKQDFSTPSFFIAEINHTAQYLIGRASRKRFNMSIKYFPDENNTDEVKHELYGVADQLVNIFKIMSYNNRTIKAYNMESRIEDDILHFMFDVKIKSLKVKDVNKFGPLEVDVNVKD